MLPQHWVIRVPNFVKVDSKPFHPDTYVGPEQDEEDSHPSESIREKSMSIKLKVENTLRWRWIKDGFGQDVSTYYSHQRLFHVECRDVNQTVGSFVGLMVL